MHFIASESTRTVSWPNSNFAYVLLWLLRPFNRNDWPEVFCWSLIALGTVARVVFCLFDRPIDAPFSDMHRHWINGERF